MASCQLLHTFQVLGDPGEGGDLVLALLHQVALVSHQHSQCLAHTGKGQGFCWWLVRNLGPLEYLEEGLEVSSHIWLLGRKARRYSWDAVVHSTCPGAGALVTEFFTSVFIHSGQQLSKHVVRHMVASSGTASSSAATTTFL